MSFRASVIWLMTGILISTIGLFLSLITGQGLVLIISLGLAILLMLIGVIGGWLGMAREKLGNRIEERRKEKYYKTHPEEK